MGKDWGRRIWLFDTLVWTVVGYEVEVWGWKEREKMEKLQERFLRWVMGVEERTPGYMVREEIKKEKLRSRTERRAWGFEERLMKGGGSVLAQKYLQELRERAIRKGGCQNGEGENAIFRRDRRRDTGMEEEMGGREVEF